MYLNSMFDGTEVILVILPLFQGSHFLLGVILMSKKNHLKSLWKMQPVQTMLNCLKQMRERGIKLGSFSRCFRNIYYVLPFTPQSIAIHYLL